MDEGSDGRQGCRTDKLDFDNFWPFSPVPHIWLEAGVGIDDQKLQNSQKYGQYYTNSYSST